MNIDFRSALENLVMRISTNDLDSPDGIADLNHAKQLLHESDPDTVINEQERQHYLYLKDRLHDNGEAKSYNE